MTKQNLKQVFDPNNDYYRQFLKSPYVRHGRDTRRHLSGFSRVSRDFVSNRYLVGAWFSPTLIHTLNGEVEIFDVSNMYAPTLRVVVLDMRQYHGHRRQVSWCAHHYIHRHDHVSVVHRLPDSIRQDPYPDALWEHTADTFKTTLLLHSIPFVHNISWERTSA